MKKNAMLKIAAVLLVAVLLTTCAISSTFAKYATDGGEFHDSARVAKWGVEATLLNTSSSGFNVTYGAAGKQVTSSNADKVVAPGTKGTMTIRFAVTGDPEVSGKVIVGATAGAEGGDFLTVGSSLKNEIKWTVKEVGGETIVNGKFGDEAIDAINEYFGNWNTTFNPNEFDEINKEVTLEWEWAFNDTAADPDADADDTKLGNAAAGIGGSAEWINFNIFADIVQTGPTVADANNY
jgi:hypothetical protein